MSHPHQPQLPAELLDYIVDHLCDSRKDLESCCLISKSWVPRIRSRIFSKIKFRTIGRVKSWKNTFPDPSTSPACYTKSLLIYCPQVTMSRNAVEGGWIPTFSGVVDLEIAGCPPSFSPVPFHGFSPVLTSLRISLYVFQPSQILDLVCSFPLLEDVSIYSFETRLVDGDDNVNEQPTALQSRSSPMLTGTLELSMQQGIDPIASGLLSLPNGLRFRKLDLTWHVEQAVSLTTALVERCYPTLEFLKVDCTFLGMPARHLHLCQLLNYRCRPVDDRGDQSTQGDETQRRSIRVRAGTPMYFGYTPNHHRRPQNAPTNNTFHAFTSAPQPRWPRRR